MTLADGSLELYRYRSDPLEQVNLSEQRPGKATRLRAKIDRWRNQVNALRYPRALLQDLDADAEEQLRVLGYLD